MKRFGLYALPAVAVAFVAFALLVVGASQPILAARVYGGPTEGAEALAWRLLVAERRAGAEAPMQLDSVTVTARLDDGRSATWQGPVDDQGLAEVVLELGGAPVTGPVDVRVTAPETPHDLLSGQLHLAAAEVAEQTTELGGFIKGAQSGALTVEVAPGRGALAVPFTEPLVVRVTDQNAHVSDAVLTFEPEGIDIRGTSGPQPVRTNARGLAVVAATPSEHLCALRVAAALPDGRRGEWYARLPILQGALHAKLQDDRLRISSPIPRERAYFAVIDESTRLAGGLVSLDPDGRGGAVQLVSLPRLPPRQVWVVVSSEADLLSAGAVGWPLVRGSSLVRRWDPLLVSGPLLTRAVPEQLLGDGFQRIAARQAARQQRSRLLSVAFVGAVLLLLALLMVRRVRASQAVLEQHLQRTAEDVEGAERIAPAPRSNLWTLAVAVLCVTLGFSLLALLLLYRM